MNMASLEELGGNRPEIRHGFCGGPDPNGIPGPVLLWVKVRKVGQARDRPTRGRPRLGPGDGITGGA